jgi:hypothetical protein
MEKDHGQVKGSAAEHIATAALLLNGYKAYHQDHESGSSDIVIEKEGKLLRCQVKSFYTKTFGNNRKPQYVACLERSGYSKSRTAENRDIRKEIDWFILVDLDTCETYMVPPKNKSSCSKEAARQIGIKLLPK